MNTLHGIGLLPVFLVGLLGSVHCAGMCGGIVAALSVPLPARAFPVPVRTVGAYSWEWPAAASHVAAYNAGRLSSYAMAGALAGGLAGGVGRLAGLPLLQAGAGWAANLMLVALGLYLLDAWRGLAWLERGGRVLWRRISPLLAKIGPFDSPGRLFAAGALWGWLPCGMVYSVLATAMLSGSASGGAAVMLAFGLGTLPMLAAIGMAGVRLRTVLQLHAVRRACGLLVLGFGLLGLWRAAGGMPASVFDILCIGAAQ
ncbi:sulfite exporter TauE/SafE family protein [Massilia sp. G4R7]|uniref:Sulfite exporter TauE/SafE family protein n=1 Tax=Massilia phyllostachyos TaxID=2898585 RepID=A0ABS8QA44_9BURK|nr:sulfite exporter TauE/SafE family protein [Massilia phyllostachyos]MCD2518484.1 sulfite exporter TauE/SafE family protein [Massilia phyllostachyos]